MKRTGRVIARDASNRYIIWVYIAFRLHIYKFASDITIKLQVHHILGRYTNVHYEVARYIFFIKISRFVTRKSPEIVAVCVAILIPRFKWISKKGKCQRSLFLYVAVHDIQRREWKLPPAMFLKWQLIKNGDWDLLKESFLYIKNFKSEESNEEKLHDWVNVKI